MRRRKDAETILGVTAFMGLIAVLLCSIVTTHHTRLDRTAASRPVITDQKARVAWDQRI